MLLLEKQCLNSLLLYPEMLYRVDRVFQQAGLVRFTVQDFENADHQALAQLVVQALEQEEIEPATFILENIPDSLREVAADLLDKVPASLLKMIDAPQDPTRVKEPNEDKRLEDLVDALARLRHVRVTENISQLRYMQEEAQEKGEILFEGLQDFFIQNYRTRERLDRIIGQRIPSE